VSHPQQARWLALIDDLRLARPEIEVAAVLSPQGLAHAASVRPGMDVDVDRLGGMSAAMLALADRTAQALARGELEQAMIKGEAGYMLMTQAGPGAVLTVLCAPDAPLGMVFQDVRFTARCIAEAP
jgi:uncharacterized protein